MRLRPQIDHIIGDFLCMDCRSVPKPAEVGKIEPNESVLMQFCEKLCQKERVSGCFIKNKVAQVFAFVRQAAQRIGYQLPDLQQGKRL